MNVEGVKKLVRALNWPKLKAHLQETPLTGGDVDNLLEVVYHSDSMVRRRPNDDGTGRNKFLDALATHLGDAGHSDAVEVIGHMRVEFTAIDAGYIAIFESESQLPTSHLTAPQRIAATLTMLQSAAKQIKADVERSVAALLALTPEPAVTDPEGKRYNPGSVIHNLGAAAFNILMMEAYRDKYFNANDEIVLPELPVMTREESEPIVGNYVTASLWKLWKSVDEKTRFLGGTLKLVPGKPAWANPLDKNLEPVVQSLEFEADLDIEGFAVMVAERFDERQRQTYLRLIGETNLSDRVAVDTAAEVPLAPKVFLSIEEGHAAVGLHHALSVELETALVPGLQLTVMELLRGFASLQQLSMSHIEKAGDEFPRLTRADLERDLARWGLSPTAISQFLNIATFGRSSRDFFDCPLIKFAGGTFLLFGWTTARADLLKVVLSSIGSQEGDIDDKGAFFEKRMLQMFREQKFDAQNILTSRGPSKDIFDYDVAFVWGNYAFFFECKNRSLPGDSPIAVHYFKHTIESHVKQVRRLRKGLEDHPDILVDRLPQAVGKTPVFCVLNAMPYASPPRDGIYFSDEGLIRRFFESASRSRFLRAGSAKNKSNHSPRTSATSSLPASPPSRAPSTESSSLYWATAMTRENAARRWSDVRVCRCAATQSGAIRCFRSCSSATACSPSASNLATSWTTSSLDERL